MKVIENNACTFCQLEEETLQHLFFDCVKIRPLFQYIFIKVKDFYPNLQITSADILLGLFQNKDDLLILFSEIIINSNKLYYQISG